MKVRKIVISAAGLGTRFLQATKAHPKGLGHAISCAQCFVGHEPFAVLLGDDIVYNDTTPCLKQMIDTYNLVVGSILGVQEVPTEHVNKYGIEEGERIAGD